MKPEMLFPLALLLCATPGQSAITGAEPIKAVPLTLEQDPGRAALGRRLFSDARLSGNGRVSCASCHDLARGGADRRKFSTGLNGKLTSTNTPTVFNAALNFRQFWDGRAHTLEDQIAQVMVNPVEMGGQWPEVLRRVAGDAVYRRDFEASYRDGVTQSNIIDALASFERTLITPNARFDQYLRGNDNAITPVEKAGYAKFKQYGCVACHQGVNVGGNMFQKFGIMASIPGAADTSPGRLAVTGRTADRHVFKVPGLRNVADTAPYFHDGSAPTLEDAVDVMFKYQLGRSGTKEDKAAIIAFLRTLSSKPVLP
jgi:cytochrome c peroxidase